MFSSEICHNFQTAHKQKILPAAVGFGPTTFELLDRCSSGFESQPRRAEFSACTLSGNYDISHSRTLEFSLSYYRVNNNTT